MPTYTAPDAVVHVFTFKEGLLSTVAHDLRLRVERFEVHIDGGVVKATFDPTSLRVDTAMKKGLETPRALSDKDKRTIEDNIKKDVLESTRFREIRFESTSIEAKGADRWTVTGALTLHGRTRSVTTTAHKQGDHVELEFSLHQPDYGITPFRAMLGTLKVKPDLKVKVQLPTLT